MSCKRLLLTVCCCKPSTEEEEDEQYLVLNHDQDEADTAAFPQTQVVVDEHVSTSNGHTVGNRLTPPDTVKGPSKSREQQEEDLLNRILHHAQESIIDVSHVENGGTDAELNQRSRVYNDAIRKHDSKRKPNRNEDESNLLGYLIADSSNSSADAHTARPQYQIQPDEMSLILKTSEMFDEAVKSGLGIQLNESLVAYMSLD